MKLTSKFIFLFIFLLILESCARRGRPEGGPKDETPPLFLIAEPAYETTNFNKKEIKLFFNEFVKLKDVNQQLVVSPPLKNPPVISPQGYASKTIKIEILDTLKTNTTYIFNFGNAVEDNNESNKLEGFKYVFSTGNYIDSLIAKGKVEDAFTDKKLKSINLLLYRIDSSYTDSIIYKRKPDYVSNTLDSTLFEFTNMRKGKYFLYALQETSNDYIYNPRTDKVGFLPDTISLPKDSIIATTVRLFKEIPEYSINRGKEITKGKIEFGFEGKPKNLKVSILSDVPANFKSISKFEKGKDTLNYWFTPIEADSLNFTVSTDNYLDTLTVRLRKNKIDSLVIKTSINGSIDLRDTVFFVSNNPIVKIDTTKISLFDKDTIAVKFDLFSSLNENKISFLFDKKTKDNYNLFVLPGAFEDIFEFKNDTIKAMLRTKQLEDYGKVTLNLQNSSNRNVIVELLDNKYNFIEHQFINTTQPVIFDLLPPKEYRIRVIIDDNKNNKWDTGDLLNKKLPEKIIYYPEIFTVRANYFINNSLIID